MGNRIHSPHSSSTPKFQIHKNTDFHGAKKIKKKKEKEEKKKKFSQVQFVIMAFSNLAIDSK